MVRARKAGAGTATHMPSNVRPYNTGGPEMQMPDLPDNATSGTGGGGGGAPPASPPAAPIPDIPIVPLSAETMDDREVTDGVDVGPGAGSEALGPYAPGAATAPDLMKLAKYLPALEAMASSPNATNAARHMVRRLRAAIPYDVAVEALRLKQEG